MEEESFSYKNDNIFNLDSLLGFLRDVNKISEFQFRFVTQLIVRLKGFQLTVTVSFATSHLQFSESDYRHRIKSLELIPDEQVFDSEEVMINE